MRNLNQIPWSARMLCLSLTCLWPLLAGNELPGKEPRVRTVSPGPLKPLPVHRRTHPIRGGIVGGAGTISPPVSPVSLLRTSAGALGFYNVAADANSLDFATNHGGPLLVSAQLELIFWGSAWQPAVNPSSNQVVTAVQSILSGPYLSQMRQYGYQSVTLRGVTYATSNPPVNYTSDDANTLVWNLIDSGAFPEPDEPGGRILYMVVMPRGTVAPGNDLGAHGDPWDYDFPG